jgi:methionine-gamma-lyase
MPAAGAPAAADAPPAAFATRCSQHYQIHARSLAGIPPPIVLASTYTLDDAAHSTRLADKPEAAESDGDGFFYSRWGSPTNQLAGKIVSELEGASAGTLTFASGMNAITSTLMTLLRSGDHVVAPKAVYGGTFEWLAIWGPRQGIDVTFVDATDVGAYAAALRPTTALLYAETPANPTMRLTDLQALGALSASTGGATKCVVDGTFATPYHVNPLAYAGVDAVIHAATKYMGGHSDLTAGTVSSHDAAFMQQLGKAAKLFGGPLPAFDSYLLVRGLRTLDVRMERHARNAARVAAFLEGHAAVAAVYYPGLPSHPDHELAKRQFRNGFGGMLSFVVRAAAGGGGDASAAAGQRVVEGVRLVNLAVSLGGVESLVEHPASMTHTMMPAAERRAAGIEDGLVRLSVGLEDPADLIEDLDQALSRALAS